MTTASSLSCPPQFGTPRSPDRETLGPRVAKVAAKLGKPLMPWQQHVLDVALEIDPYTGELAYDEVGLTVPRQSGKSTLILAKFVHRGLASEFFGRRQQMVYTAQTRKKALEKWREDYVAEIESSPLADRVTPHYPSGGEHLRFPNGSRFAVESNTEKAGHGGTLDEVYLDEAFAHQDGRLEQAFTPAMITRRNKQMWVVSTAGWQDGSPYLRRKVKRGREQADMGVREGLAYFEWSAPEDAEPDDRDVWRSCMPALGHTITERAIANELAKHQAEGKLNDFRRAYLNQWVLRPADVEESLVATSVWDALTDNTSRITGRPVLAVEIGMTRAEAAIAVAGSRSDGLPHVELVESREGTSWAVERLVQLHERHVSLGVVLDKGGPAATLVPDLEAASVPVIGVNTSGLAEACGSFFDMVQEQRVRHPLDVEVTAALAAGRPRPLSERWAWSRQTPGAPLLLAVTLALHGYTTNNSVEAWGFFE